MSISKENTSQKLLNIISKEKKERVNCKRKRIN